MTVPKLSQPSSGLGGRGYRRIFGEGDVVPSVTTALSALEKPGIVNWHIENTVAHMIANKDRIAMMDDEPGFRFLQYYTRRLNGSKVDDLGLYDYSQGVLSDLAELGDFIHSWIDDALNDRFTTDPWRDDQEQMVVAFLEWWDAHDVEVVATEQTVFGETASGGWAGTFDFILKVDGVTVFGDIKTSRTVYDSHVAQLAALSSAHTMAREVPEGTPGAVYHKMPPTVAESHGGQVDSWWVPEPLPAFQEYGILRVRPDDYDKYGNFIPAFCRLERIDTKLVDAAFGLFEAGLAARHAQRLYKKIEKEATA